MTHTSFNLHAVIMAGGKGTRMQATDKPKVLFQVNGRPMLTYVVDAAKQAGVNNPVIVIGYLGEQVKVALGPDYTYVVQAEQKGTGHAVMMAAPILEHQKGVTLILSGDHPLIKPETLQKLAQAVEHGATMAILSGHMDSPHFDSLGRIITDSHDNVKKIVEVKNATEAEKAIRHMNLGTYAVDNAWLWQTLKKVGKDPVTSEYYLTAIIGMAVEEGKTVTAVEIEDEHEAIGINTPEHLQEAEASLTASSQ